MITSEDLQSIVDDAAAHTGLVGGGAAVLHGNDIVEAAFGMANVAAGIEATTEALCQVGSTTKVLNAALVMSLVDDGTVDLDAPITMYAGDEWMPPDVTLRHLLSMTSGVDSGQILDIGDDAGSVARFVQLQREFPPFAKPGEMFFYSNAGSTIAGRIAEIVTGKIWDDAFRERVLEPSGMQHSGTVWEEVVYHRLAIGHRRTDDGTIEPIRPVRYGRCRAPAGSTLWSTAGDLIRFGAVMLHAGLALDGTRVLSEKAVADMHVQYADVPHFDWADGWCLGPLVKTIGRHRVFGHAGGAFGGGSLLRWIPELDLAIATVTNTPAVGKPFYKAVHHEVMRRFGVDVEPEPVFEPIDGVDVTPFVGRYEFSGASATYEEQGGALVYALEGLPPVRLEAIGERLFRAPGYPGDPVLFLGDQDGKATHTLTGVWAMRRVS